MWVWEGGTQLYLGSTRRLNPSVHLSTIPLTWELYKAVDSAYCYNHPTHLGAVQARGFCILLQPSHPPLSCTSPRFLHTATAITPTCELHKPAVSAYCYSHHTHL